MKKSKLLLRNVHPNHIEKSELTSQAFFPFPKDNGDLSTYDGQAVLPASCYTHYTKSLGFQSAGIWGVSSDEVGTVGLTWRDDPVFENPNHCVIEFYSTPFVYSTNKFEKEFRKIAKELKKLAIDRGCLFLPEGD